MVSPLRLYRRFRALFSLARRDRELDQELQFHLEMEAEKLRASGVGETAARTEARRIFGSVTRYRDETRDSRGVRPIEDLINDARLGARTLLRQPAFALVAILTLAIG